MARKAEREGQTQGVSAVSPTTGYAPLPGDNYKPKPKGRRHRDNDSDY